MVTAKQLRSVATVTLMEDLEIYVSVLENRSDELSQETESLKDLGIKLLELAFKTK